MPNGNVACDLFAGAGGLSEGLRWAGFDIRVANEINNHAALTYRLNHPDTVMIERDIRKVNAKEITDVSGTDILLVAGGVPCQGVSTAGRRGLDDPRNKLFMEFVKMVRKLDPGFFLLENVVGLLSMDGGRLVEKIEKHLASSGYFCSRRVFDATSFGVPQRRRRVFIFGCKDGKHDINDMETKSIVSVSVSDAIGDLDFLKAGESSKEYVKQPTTGYQKRMRNGQDVLHNHEAPRHSASTMKRFSMMRPGASIKDIPQKLRIRKRDMFRLKRSEPARTVTTCGWTSSIPPDT